MEVAVRWAEESTNYPVVIIEFGENGMVQPEDVPSSSWHLPTLSLYKAKGGGKSTFPFRKSRDVPTGVTSASAVLGVKIPTWIDSCIGWRRGG